MAIISPAAAQEAAPHDTQEAGGGAEAAGAEHIGAGATQAHGGAHESGGFPPFESQNFAPQLVWLALIFGLLYVLMSRIALPRVGRILSNRESKIAADLDASREMQAKAQSAALANDETLRLRRAEAQAIGRSAQESISAEIAARRGAEERIFKGRLDEADRRIAADKTQALASVEQIATEAAAAILGKLTGGEVDPAALTAEYRAVQSN